MFKSLKFAFLFSSQSTNGWHNNRPLFDLRLPPSPFLHPKKVLGVVGTCTRVILKRKTVDEDFDSRAIKCYLPHNHLCMLLACQSIVTS